jgi:hypothetical protein
MSSSLIAINWSAARLLDLLVSIRGATGDTGRPSLTDALAPGACEFVSAVKNSTHSANPPNWMLVGISQMTSGQVATSSWLA